MGLAAVWSFLVSTGCFGLGLVYPAYGSINAIESRGAEDDTQWLVYWLCYSVLLIVERLAWPVLRWIPLYTTVKMVLLAWMVLPQTKGATWVYEELLRPGLALAQRELSKVPALEKALERAQGPPPAARSATENAEAISTRKQRLNDTIVNMGRALDGELARISSLEDSARKIKAEKAFDKDLGRISKIASKSGADPSFFSPLRSHAQ